MHVSASKKVAAVLGAGAIAVGASGVAYAYWSTTGGGSTTTTTSTGVSNQLGFATATLTDMFPGDSAQGLTVTVTNNSAQKVYVTTVKAYLTVATATGVTGTCDSSDYLLDATASTSSTSPVTLNWTAQELGNTTATNHANNGTGDTIQFNDKSSNQDACKGATVTIHYVAS